MKKWWAFIVLVLGLSLLCSCQKPDNPESESSIVTPVVAPVESQLTYCFIPNSSGAHMFDINSVNLDGSQQQVLLKATDVGFNQPDWTADGTTMAIWGWHNPDTISIYTYNTKTDVLTRLTNQMNVYDMFPHWNASDDKIVFTRQYLLENSRNEIWSMNPDGSDAKKLVDGYTGSWSPDGKQILYSHVSDGNEDLYTCNNDGSGIVKLLDSPSNETFPMWSPDGSNIAFLSQADGADDNEIYVMNADGSGAKSVTTTEAGSYATLPSRRPLSAQNEAAKSISLNPYTRTEKLLGEGRSFDQCKGDFNGDGQMDVFVTSYEGESGLYLKTSQGYELSPFLFSTTEDNGHGIASGDLDNDVDLDAFVANYQRPAHLLLNNGLGHFTSSELGTFETETIKVLVTDFNQDGALDAYFVNQDRHDQIAINDGKGGLTVMPELYGESVSWGGASTGDLNGDGYPDVVVTNEEVGAGIWLNDETGKLSKYGEYIGTSSTNVLLEDLDQDGDLDMVTMVTEQGAELYLNDGLANFEFYKSLENSYGATSALVMDFDGDGQLDILIGRMTGGNVIYYYQ